MPDTLPVAQLESYFRGRMRSANSAVNEMRVLAGLRKTALFASQSALFLGEGGAGPGGGGGGRGGRNRRVVIGEERVCGVCHKRIGGSVVAVLPDNAVVHYGCLNRVGGGGGGVAASRPMSPFAESGSVSGSVKSGSKVGGFGSWGQIAG